MTRKKKAKSSTKKKARSTKRKSAAQNKKKIKKTVRFSRFLLGFTLILLVYSGYYVYTVDLYVQSQFDGKRWALPARVYARPLEIYPGINLSASQFELELSELRYRKVISPHLPGTYSRLDGQIHLITRAFHFGDHLEPSKNMTLSFNQHSLVSISSPNDEVDITRLDPPLIASIFPHHHEDRILIQSEQIPDYITKGLIAVEDRHFYQHKGIDPLAIARAMWANVKARSIVQGGSTLTQQLVKNHFLSAERSLIRKINEAVMSLILEWRYSKADILQAYLNEIYLGQDGNRAIHGIGLASQYYFDQPANELNIVQSALLITLIRGASYYDPRKHPERATKRRNRVISILLQQGVISTTEASLAIKQPLGVTKRPQSGVTRYPAYLDLVKHQLRRDYQESDLRNEGLRIFTSLDPTIQKLTESILETTLKRIESQNKDVDQLQGAAIVINRGSGEVLAIAGGRFRSFSGFNRALNAKRPIGSLIKPFIYLTALDQFNYTPTSILDDTPLKLKNKEGHVWAPKNYDHQFHGQTPLYQSLIHSFNVSTVRLGLKIGIPSIIKTLKKTGIDQDIQSYPSLLLGAINLSPFEVAQLYHSIANEGFYRPLQSLRTVLNQHHQTLQRYPMDVQPTAKPSSVYILNRILQQVTRIGSARSIASVWPELFQFAGKTGTTNDLRDSWFSGYSGNYLTTVWVGRDDNVSAGLTGSRGALQVWIDIMKKLDTTPLTLTKPSDVIDVPIDIISNKHVPTYCSDNIILGFIKNKLPERVGHCF